VGCMFSSCDLTFKFIPALIRSRKTCKQHTCRPPPGALCGLGANDWLRLCTCAAVNVHAAFTYIDTVGERRVVERTAGRTWPVVIEIWPQELWGWWS